MQKTLIELESKIHSLQCATKDERDKFIFQICRQLIQDKIDNQHKDERIVEVNETIISDKELQEIIRASDILSMHGKIPNEYREGYRHGLEYYHNTLKRKSK